MYNDRRRDAMKEVTKKIKRLVTQGKGSEAKTLVSVAYQAFDKAAKTGVIKKNAAARKKSRLMRLLVKASK